MVASKDIGTLSYAEQISLPGYTFANHWQATRYEPLPELIRPPRRDVSDYLTAYPKAVGIVESVRCSEKIDGVSRSGEGFYVASHNLFCRNLVLASGTFSINLPPPRGLAPLASLNSSEGPVLVIGSGFTAADIMISTPAEREIIHVFKWDPENRPSPLKACHSHAYPEYAWIYKQMKIATRARVDNAKHSCSSRCKSHQAKRLELLPHFSNRDWARTYSGFPNGQVSAISKDVPGLAQDVDSEVYLQGKSTGSQVAISMPGSSIPIIRNVTTLQYATGRRGSLAYLSQHLLHEVMYDEGCQKPPEAESMPHLTRLLSSSSSRVIGQDPWTEERESSTPSPPGFGNISATEHKPHAPTDQSTRRQDHPQSSVSGLVFRGKIEDNDTMEVAPSVYAIGSLTGDSLVRYAFGSCCVVAGAIQDSSRQRGKDPETDGQFSVSSASCASPDQTFVDIAREQEQRHNTKVVNRTPDRPQDFHGDEHSNSRRFPPDRRKGIEDDCDSSLSVSGGCIGISL